MNHVQNQGEAGAGRNFPPLPVANADDGSPGRPLKICVVTPDIAGPNRNGGIGTAYRHAAELLAQAGHEVTILFALGARSEDGPFERWVREFARKGIKLVPLPEPEIRNSRGYVSAVTTAAYGVYEWLKGRTFDVVHVSEWQGTAYYCLLAKHQGLAFNDTLFCVKTSSPTLWNLEGNSQPVDDARILLLAHMERRSVELADVVISGSAYMLGWMRQHGYALPEGRTFVQPNIILTEPGDAGAGQMPGLREVNELVFFGRIEPRKGLMLFCDAVKRLNERKTRSFTITFLGKHSAKMDSGQFIRKHAAGWKSRHRIIDDMGQRQAIQYLSQPGRLAVMPSILDNSPLGVYECLIHGLPFLASAVGGGPELIHADDRSKTLFPVNPEALADLLEANLANGAVVPKAALDFVANNAAWLAWHNRISRGRSAAPAATQVIAGHAPGRPPDAALVSVCIPHHERPRLLAQAIQSLERQTYPNLEVIVVDDGSQSEESRAFLSELEARIAARGWKVMRQKNLYAAAARNTAARNASGKYLYFLDDDNCAKPAAIATLVRIAERTQADILTCFGDVFSGLVAPGDETRPETRLTYVGDGMAFGLIANGFGDTHSLVLKQTFDALGGFREEYGVGKEDLEFFARAVLSGYQLQQVPEALYWYRRSEQRIRERHFRRFAGAYRVARPYLDAVPPGLQPLLLLAQGLVETHSVSGQFQRLPSAGSVNADAMAGVGDLLTERPRLHRFAKRILRAEMVLWNTFIRAQIVAGAWLLRQLAKSVKFMRQHG